MGVIQSGPLQAHVPDMEAQSLDEANQQVRPLVRLETNNVEDLALIDTGATISCISQTAADRMGVRRLDVENKCLKAVNGNRLKIVGKCKVIFALDECLFKQEFMIISDLNCNIILGQDFLVGNKMCVDFCNNCISFSKGKIHFVHHKVGKQRQSEPAFVAKQNPEKRIKQSNSELKKGNTDGSANVSSRPAVDTIVFQELGKSDYIYFSKLPDSGEFSLQAEENRFIINEELILEEKRSLLTLLEQNADRFAFSNEQLGRSTVVQVDIKTSDEEPVRCHPYRTSPVQREVIDEQVREMLKLGVIRESTSPYAAPVVLVKKPDDSWRFCIDYRKLNKKIRRDNYPIPRIDDIIDNLTGAQYFAELDLNAGYWQTEITNGKHKTAFVTSTGLYEFNVVPFGLATSQAVFQRMMDKVLGDLKYKGVMVYVDNVIVFGKTFEEFMNILNDVFRRFREANLTFKPSKCKFGLKKIEVLGYMISGVEIRPSENKIKAMRDVRAPTSAKEVKQVLGLFSYYRKFIPDLARITLPLTKLLKKGVKFHWNSEHQDALDYIKRLMCSEPILSYFSTDKALSTRLYVDASNEAIGAVLMQGRMTMCPIAYASRKLSEAEKKYSTTEKECLSLVWALRYFRHYLWGLHFQVVTDHRALCWLQSKRDMYGRLARWALAIQEWDFDIVHCTGKSNVVADFLSRNPLVELSDPQVDPNLESSDGLEIFSINIDSLAGEQANDPFCNRWFSQISERPDAAHGGFFLRNNFLYKRVRRSGEIRDVLVLPKSMFQNVMHELHDEAWTGGHLGLAKTLKRFRSRYFMQYADREIERYVRSCVPCQERKMIKNVAELIPIRVSNIFEKVGIDVLGPFPRSTRDNRYIIMSVEYASRFAICKAVPRVTAEDIVRFLIEEIFCRFGDIQEIISDRGTVFTARIVKETVERFGAKCIHTSSFHPQCNGLVERLNRTLVAMLSKYLGNNQRDWCSFLPLVVHAYNTSVQATTKISPYNILFGREQSSVIDRTLGLNVAGVNESMEERVDRMRSLLTKALRNIARAQIVQKRYYDRRVRPVSFNVNDLVLLYVPRRVTGRCTKLARLFQGPYKIIGQVGRSNVVIRRLNTRSRGVVVHTNRLKHFMSR